MFEVNSFSFVQICRSNNQRRHYGPRRSQKKTFGRQNSWIFLLKTCGKYFNGVLISKFTGKNCQRSTEYASINSFE